MSDADEEGVFERTRRVVDEAFPDITCLRCGNDQLFLDTTFDAKRYRYQTEAKFDSGFVLHGRGPIVTLICSRCGHIEEHVRDVLESADKPVSGGTKNG